MRLLLFAFLVACVPVSYTYTPASNRAVSPKPEDCKIELLSTAPSGAFEEIGYLELYNGDPPNNVDKFRDLVHAQVCRAGGDAVIAIANDHGQYSKGTIIKYPERFKP